MCTETNDAPVGDPEAVAAITKAVQELVEYRQQNVRKENAVELGLPVYGERDYR